MLISQMQPLILPCSVTTGRSAFLLVADQGSGDGLDLSQPAINAIDAEWFRGVIQ